MIYFQYIYIYFYPYQNGRNLDSRLKHFILMNYFVPIKMVEIRFHIKESLFSKIKLCNQNGRI